MKRWIVLLFAIIFIVLGSIIWMKGAKQVLPDDGKLSVVTSFYPLYFFASQIALDKATVLNITPAGTEPHDYEPTTQDIATIERSDIVILNGAGLETWSEKIQDMLKNSGTKFILVADKTANLKLDDQEKPFQDPHTWLDPILAKEEIKTITAMFISVDPANEISYQTNSNALLKKMDQLDLNFKNGLKSCALNDVVTSHAAFGYLASRYRFTQIPISGVSPDEEPSPKKLAEIVSITRDKNVRYIFFETLISSRLAETIAEEVGAKTLVFNPLEGLTEQEQQEGVNYFTVQEENIKNLHTALECN